MPEVYRREVKYIISIEDFYCLRKQLEHLIEPDEYSGLGGYMVRSLYFDSCHDNDLRDVLDGLEEKSKIRLRIYSTDDSDASVKLEYKCKYGADSRKLTLNLSRDEATHLAQGDYSQLLNKGDPLAVRLYGRLKTGAYQPKVIIEYNRMAYVYLPNNTRITFDSNVYSSSVVSAFFNSKVPGQPVLFPGIGVLEVKYNGFLFGHLRKTLDDIDSLALSNSKYAIGRLVSHF